jgi:hypothetical protein
MKRRVSGTGLERPATAGESPLRKNPFRFEMAPE